MSFRIAALLSLIAVGAAVGAVASAGVVGIAPARPYPKPQWVVKYYDPLP